MADWSLEWLTAPPPMPYDPYQFAEYDPYYGDKQPPLQQPAVQRTPPLPPQAQPYLSPPPPPSLTLLQPLYQRPSPPMIPLPTSVPAPMHYLPTLPKVDNPREIRNKAEKQRRDKLNQSIAELAALVPPVVFSARKIDKTGVLRYTAHYLRAHQYVFAPAAEKCPEFSPSSTQALLGLLNGFLLTTTYKGLVVVVSQNVNEYLGYTELELLGRSIFGIVHEEDRELLREQLMPKSQTLGLHGELLLPDEQDGREKMAEALANEKRRFVVRFMKLGQRSEPSKYVTCHVEGSLRMSDRACRGHNPCCQIVRRARARGDNPCSSGNDVVFIGIVRPSTETFITESALEAYKMEYRTRHSIDGEIIECEQRIALVTGYMTSEVNGVNAMNFIHRDEVRWVIIALKEMYKQNHLFGESCYRLMMKNGEFIYMRTRGKLDVDATSGAVTSFVCTNTVVDEKEGKHFIRMMKERFTLQASKNGQPAIEDVKDSNDSQAVEDPRQLEKVILNLVTNLPSPQASNSPKALRGKSPSLKISIIPPEKERIVSAIEKIYSVIKTIPKTPSILHEEPFTNEAKQALTPNYSEASEIASFNDAYFQVQSGSETELNSDTGYSPAPSSDLDYAPGVGTRSYDEMSSIGFSNGAEVDSTQPDVAFPVFSPPALVPLNGFQNQLALEPIQPGPIAAGLKRPNRFDDQEMATKKKIIDVPTEQSVADQTSGHESPSLETFFDEAIFNTQIQSAMDSLEETIDPSFPDLLISKEVEDILEKIEDDQSEK